MATSKPPKNDFAPAWLKIPEGESSQPSGSKSTEQEKSTSRPNRRDDYFSGGYDRYRNPEGYNGPLQRQRSFDNYHDGGEHDRRYSPQKFRHHSIDDDFYGGANNYGPGYYNGYNYEKCGNHYRSQPSLYRDSKYTHPNARYAGNGSQVQQPSPNGGVPPYPPYEPGYDYYGGDPYYGSYGGPPPPGNKRPPYDGKHMGSMADKDGMTKDSTGQAKKEISIEYDFPSLNGDVARPEPKPLGTSGVWDTTNKDFALSKNNNVYKAQLPAKGSISKRQSNRDIIPKSSTGSDKDVNSNNKDNLLATSGPLAKNGRDVGKESTSQPIEIVTQSVWSATPAKPLAENGLDRVQVKVNEQGELPAEEGCKTERIVNGGRAVPSGESTGQQDTSLINGIDDLSLGSHLDDKLSSSLEAEQRLLKEMGWNEMDNDDCFITEEEIREFQKLKELKAQRNGFSKPAPPQVWSPQHKVVYDLPALQDLNDLSTSEDSDSDLD